MNGKKYEKIMDTEAEFKAFMKEYEEEMKRLRNIHQNVVKNKGFTIEPGSPTNNIDTQLSLTKKSLSREEIKSQEIDTKSSPLEYK